MIYSQNACHFFVSFTVLCLSFGDPSRSASGESHHDVPQGARNKSLRSLRGKTAGLPLHPVISTSIDFFSIIFTTFESFLVTFRL